MIIIYFLIKSLRIEPCVKIVKIDLFLKINRVWRFVFKYSQVKFDFKKCFTKSNPILKVCIILLIKNNTCHFDSQMKQFNIKQALQFPSPPPPASLAAAKVASQELIQLNNNICICESLKDKYYFLLIK